MLQAQAFKTRRRLATALAICQTRQLAHRQLEELAAFPERAPKQVLVLVVVEVQLPVVQLRAALRALMAVRAAQPHQTQRRQQREDLVTLIQGLAAVVVVERQKQTPLLEPLPAA